MPDLTPRVRSQARWRTAVCFASFAWLPIWWWVQRRGRSSLRASELASPARQIVVLGALVRHGLTPILEDRLLTAAALFRAGKSSRVLLTGTSAEVSVMSPVLQRAGVPASAIDLDPQSAHTFESISKLPRGLPLLLVSQRFHLPRALYIARTLGVSAQGVCADLRTYRGARRYLWREIVSSVLAFWMARAQRRMDRQRVAAVG